MLRYGLRNQAAHKNQTLQLTVFKSSKAILALQSVSTRAEHRDPTHLPVTITALYSFSIKPQLHVQFSSTRKLHKCHRTLHTWKIEAAGYSNRWNPPHRDKFRPTNNHRQYPQAKQHNTPSPNSEERSQQSISNSKITAMIPINRHLLEEVICRPVVILQRQAIVHIDLLRLGRNAQRSSHLALTSRAPKVTEKSAVYSIRRSDETRWATCSHSCARGGDPFKERVVKSSSRSPICENRAPIPSDLSLSTQQNDLTTSSLPSSLGPSLVPKPARF